MLYLIGLGIHDEKDISQRGIEAARSCEKVFIELYTCPLKIDMSALEKAIGRKIEILSRKDVEDKNLVVKCAKSRDTALLVGGDALSATTHITIALDAKKAGVPVKVIHASSIFTAVAECGLQLYKFGPAVSLPKPQPNYSPDSSYDNILENKKRGLHTLILLDIGMPANEGIRILSELEKKKKGKLFTDASKIVVAARLGGESIIRYGKLSDLSHADFGDVPHSIILPGKLHFVEEEFLELLK